jgi:hypothetical protein
MDEVEEVRVVEEDGVPAGGAVVVVVVVADMLNHDFL